LLLAKLKMDNLRQLQYTIHHEQIEQDRETILEVEEEEDRWISESARSEYDDLKSVSLYRNMYLLSYQLTAMLDYSSVGVSFSK
jgi:hypothetical protein